MSTKRLLTRTAWLVGMVVALAVASPAAAEPAGKVYAVVILDTKAGDVGQADISEGAKTDGKNVEAFLQGGIGEGLLEIRQLQGEQASWAGLTKYLADVHPGRDEALFCFIACHGGTPKPDWDRDAHIVGLSGTGRLEKKLRSDLRSELVKKGAGLTILITDACSDDCPPLKKKDRDPVTFGNRRRLEVSPAFQPLFLEAKGVVDINAAFASTSAWSDQREGGIFTRALHKTFYDLHLSQQKLTWPEFYDRLKENTEDLYRAWRDDQITKMEDELKRGQLDADRKDDLMALHEQESQTPQAYYLAGVKLGLTVVGTDGEGMEVENIPFDSPVQGKLRRKERILKANGEGVLSTDDWKRVIRKALDAGQTRFTFEVVDLDGKQRTEEIILTGR